MGANGASDRFWAEFRVLYEAAGKPTLASLVRLGEQQVPPLRVSDASISEWLNRKSVPAGKSTRAFLVLVELLQARASRAGHQPRPQGWWQRILKLAQEERRLAQRAGRPPGPAVPSPVAVVDMEANAGQLPRHGAAEERGRPEALPRGRTTDDEITVSVHPVPITVGLPLRNPHFVGREDLLAAIHADLGSATVLAVQALHGLAGVGKTQLAVEYVYRHLDDYDLIVWLAAEQATLIPDMLADLAPKLQLPPGASVPETASAVVNALPICGLRWLLVFDNAERPDDLVPFVPRFGGRVIITSRQAGWSSLGTAMNVDVMTPAEAVTLLTRRLSTSSSPLTPTIAYAIADQLGDLPLALEQAAAYLDRTAIPAEQYLGLLQTRLQDMLALGTVVGHEATLATLELSRQHLAVTSPAAAHLLETAGYLGPEPIPLDLFTNHPDLLPAPLAAAAADSVAFANTVGQVIGFSLARRTNDGFTVHRLVATAIRTSLVPAQSETVLTTVLDLLYADTPDKVAGPQSCKYSEVL